ncbi:hypothetical protein I6I97_17510 [Sphingobacterium multivorum]|uniref:hypothetical protein n=1 Tax=Sphingobacterium multivorum TaxID=28454 RepID=UPI001917F4E3|nr:hypothetical protein [Sphingobacterium multivorum]QQT60998.1 hypothetical protein I6I97_17510 [Sphingobacterium multivorum]
MRIFLITVVCILFSGCGLFRKTTKVNKQLDAVAVSSDVKVSTETTEGKVDKTKETLNLTTESDDKVMVYPTPGSDVKVASDGSVTFKADSIVSFTKRKTDQAREILRDISENLHQNVNLLAKKDSTDEKKLEIKNIDQAPSSLGIFSNWIGFAVGLFILICGVIWFLRRK